MAQAVTGLPYTFQRTVKKGELVQLLARLQASFPIGIFKVPGCAATFQIWSRISASGDELITDLKCVDAAEGFKRLPGMTQVKATVSMSVEATQGATTVMAKREMHGPKHGQVYDSTRRWRNNFTCKVSAADGTVLSDDATFKLAVTVTSLSHDFIDLERATARLQLNPNAGKMVPGMYGKAEYSDVVIVVPAALRAVAAAAHGEQEEQEPEPELMRMPCHRSVLAAASEPLDKMLSSSSHFKEGSHREVALQEVRPSVAKAFLQWCYGLPVEVTLAQAVGLWLYAEQYMVSALSDSCCKALLEAVSSNDAPGALLQLHQLAQELAPDCGPAQALWRQLLAEPNHVCTALPTACAASLPIDKVKAAVSAANASPSCNRAELAVAVLRWALLGGTNESSLEAHLPEMLRCVTLADVPVETLQWLADRCSAAAPYRTVRDRAVAAEVLGDIVGVLAACCTRLRQENAEHQHQAAKRRRL